ncbi:MAG TPA: two-component system response regulator [Alphaproteobacteria bacterium]|nr:two-component system response regulator [Alphaproteobacteria bacterium]
MAVDKGIRVLIVDDYQTMRGVIRNLFNLIGFENTVEAGTTGEALEILKKGGCGLVIFDWRTGPMPGEDFLKTVRADETVKDIPFIVVSAESNDELTDVMRRAGAADFIAKPFTKATLEKRLTALFGEM